MPGAVSVLLSARCSAPRPEGAVESVIELHDAHACYWSASHRFCYANTRAPQWHDIWTRVQVRGEMGGRGAGPRPHPAEPGPAPAVPTCASPPPRVQIRINSSRGVRVTQVDSEEELRELEKFRVWNFLFSFLKEKLNDTSIDVDLYGNKTCLKVEVLEAGTTYCVVLSRRTSALLQGSAGPVPAAKGRGPAGEACLSPRGAEWGAQSHRHRALVGGLPQAPPLPTHCWCVGMELTPRVPCQGFSQPVLFLFPGFDPKLFLVFFLGLLLFFCGDVLSR